MKILVAVKRVVDYKAIIRIKPDGSAVETANVKMAMNPFDEIAVEEALRLKEKGFAKEVVVVSIGAESCQETLRTALAMGADRAILVKSDESVLPLTVAKILKNIIENETPELVILGKQAIDTDDNQTGQMLAGLLNWAQGTFASKVEIKDKTVSVTREIDGGLETLNLTLPAVITTDLRLNEPRYIALPNIMKAKSKTLTVVPLADLNIATTSSQKLIKVSMPEKSRKKIYVDNAADLIARLKLEGGVI